MGCGTIGCGCGSQDGNHNVSLTTNLKSENSELLSKDNDDNEEKRVEYKRGDVIVMQFSADWCAPCRGLKASIKQDQELQKYFKDETKGYFIIDVDDKDKISKAWVNKANPSSIPLVVIYHWDGQWKELSRFMGLKPTKEILEWLKYNKKKIPTQ